MDMEQYPEQKNRISLSSVNDEYGRKIALIEWKITHRDMRAIEAAADNILRKWPGKAGGLPELIPRTIDSTANKPYDAYHPVGVCRMGERGSSVVDSNLSVWGIENLSVVSTGVLPSAGTANPTFTKLCMAHQLADYLSK